MTFKILLLSLLCLTRAHAIINGQSCEDSVFPASLALIKLENGQVMQFCGATLIAPDIAITAAHCVEDIVMRNRFSARDEDYYVTSKKSLNHFDITDFSSSSTTTIRIRRISMHSGFVKVNNHSFTDDIALLFLERPSHVPPVRMMHPSQANWLARGSLAYIVGWGQQRVGSKGVCSSPTIKTMAASYINQLMPGHFQLGSDSNSPRICFGDSGGAAYMQIDSTLRLIGITSYTDHACLRGGFDLRVDTYYDWIIDTINSACQTGGRLFCAKPRQLVPQ